MVRLRAATVCGSDWHTVSGRRSSPCPSVLGHEGAGTVVAVGEGTPVGVGERVVFGVTVACGHCARCRRGMTAKCEHVRKVGHEPYDGGWVLSGTYATHILLPVGSTVVPVPPEIADAPAATAGCAGATTVAALAQVGPLAGRRVLVNGVGMLGLTAVAMAAGAGAEVTAADPVPSRRTLAERAGAVRVCGDLGTADSGSQDVVLDFSGRSAGVAAAVATLDVGGVAVLVGSVSPAPPVSVDPEWVVRGWRTITGVHNYEPGHLHRAVELLADPGVGGRIPWETVLDGPVSLADLPAHFAGARGEALRTVVVPD